MLFWRCLAQCNAAITALGLNKVAQALFQENETVRQIIESRDVERGSRIAESRRSASVAVFDRSKVPAPPAGRLSNGPKAPKTAI